ncbi:MULTISPECIES: Imm10 family immunity protein [Micromonospora]|uniref:Imm10 family immunity protein n=1 Tax=Micromonospora TaxID=1873 RepID=UPI0011CDD224|nr:MULTISPECIES: Imm10 family immunity protein [Micromonospora]NES16772.1 hypothetical protein [Micromonospora sp. PPF5-17B]NES37737.1 hypothetical protein [Micromonospora solifontis]NES58881.1 hypothetical protein [Micromonospora sp. PPF5-6]
MGDDDSEGYVLGVRESTEPGSWSLLFMECGDDLDDQEIDLGWDTYCLVVDPGQATYYGGVLACRVTDRHLYLRLTSDAAETLGLPTELTFALELPSDRISLLKRGLTRVFTSGRANAQPGTLAV